MIGKLLVGGDPLPHVHQLPPIPIAGWFLGRGIPLENAVAECACGRLFVSREDPDGWGRVVVWTPLRWYHRTARRKLREKIGESG